MKWQDYHLENTILKAEETLTLLQTEKCIVKINEKTLAVPVKLNGKRKGYVFHGNGRLILDTIVETREGAIGKPIEKEISEPFLMIGCVEKIEHHLNVAEKDDLIGMGFKNQQEFISKTWDLCKKYFRKSEMLIKNSWSGNEGFIFAFLNDVGEFDILLSKDSKLIYRAVDRTYISTENKSVLKTLEEMIPPNSQKLLVIRKGSKPLILFF